MSRAAWQPEAAYYQCHICSVTFSFFTRKHHCRACGEVVCSSCSPAKIAVAGYLTPELACTTCINSSRKASQQPSISPETAERVRHLCQSYQSRVMDPQSGNIARHAAELIGSVQGLLPPPIGTIARIASHVLKLSSNAVINNVESVRLANRIHRIHFTILAMAAKPGCFPGASLAATDLLAAFGDAVKLLESFQPEDAGRRGFVDVVKAKFCNFQKGLRPNSPTSTLT